MHTYETHIIKESMCDCFRRLKLQHMFIMMQDAAYKDLLTYGCGRKSLLDKDVAFLLRRSVVEVINAPRADDTVVVGTSQISLQGMTYTRDFIFICNDEICVKASTQWFLCKISDKSLIRPTIQTISYSGDSVGISIDNKPEIPDDRGEIYNTIKIGYSSIDGNMHVNNTEYVSWVCDAPNAISYLEEGHYSFDIYFKKEVIPHDTVDLYQINNVVYGISQNQTSFIAKFK